MKLIASAIVALLFVAIFFGLVGAAMIYVHPMAGLFTFVVLFALACRVVEGEW